MNLAKWVNAMNSFYFVNLDVKPKKARLAIAEAEYAEVMVTLKAKQAELKIIVDKVNVLKAELLAF
jgi:dynein heavy chain